jgi:3-oxoacyl-[acyl-carrier-protein] synthase II
MTDQIVITGIGIVSPLGSDVDTAVRATAERKSGLAETDRFGPERRLGAVQGFDVADYLNPKKARRMDPINCYTIAAGSQALAHAALPSDLRRDCGLLVGTGFSGLSSVVEHQKKFLRDGIKTLSPAHFPTTVYNASAGLAAIELGVAGPNSTITGVDVSGEYALLYASMMLRQGLAERILVVGADELSSALVEAFHDMGLAGDEESYPFARRRSGFTLSEGAAALLLETEKAALERGAKILGTIEGIGLRSSAKDAFGHDSDGAVAAIDQALTRAGRELADIDWVSSPANGGKNLDRADAEVWRQALGDASAKVSAIKAHTGEFAASGVLRLALGLACAQRGVVPAMNESVDYDEGIASLLNYGTERERVSRFLHHGSGVGGSHVSVVVGCGYAA